MAELALERSGRVALCRLDAVDAALRVIATPASVGSAQGALHALLNLSSHPQAQRAIAASAMAMLVRLRDRPPTRRMGAHVLGVLANVADSEQAAVRIQVNR